MEVESLLIRSVSGLSFLLLESNFGRYHLVSGIVLKLRLTGQCVAINHFHIELNQLFHLLLDFFELFRDVN